MKRKYSGFTLVELLTVVVIIGVLVGLTLPAVQSARMSARQATCLNNLKQVAVAAASFETSMGYLPYHTGEYGPEGNRITASWVVPLLPHLGETALWGEWETGNPQYNTLPILICPSSPKKKKNVAGLSYVANSGYWNGNSVEHDSGNIYAFQLGALVPLEFQDEEGKTKYSKRALTSKMKDGATYTILFSENNQATAWNSINVCEYGILWQSGSSVGFGADHKSTTTSPAYARPSSNHPQNGANVAFADGSVKYLTRGVTHTLYCQLMAPNDKKAAEKSGNSALGNAMDTTLLN